MKMPLAVVVFVIVIVILLNNVEKSVELKSSHPLHDLVDRINEKGGPFIGLVMAIPTEELALVNSGLFVPSSDLPWLDLSGRRYNIGKIRGVDVIYVMTGEKTLNAGITVQILLDVFDIKGIVHYGIAGSANDSLFIGDVSIPKYVVYTASWTWKGFQSEDGDSPELKFGDYNFPEKGENLLATIEFTSLQLYSVGQPMEEVFWLPIDPNWFTLASQLQDVKLQQCVSETYCLPDQPKVVHGLRASTADVFLQNAAYRKFLFNEFNVSTVDEESSAILMTALTNGVPCIVFRGVSDSAGGPGERLVTLSSSSIYYLAAVNALNVAVEFIGLFSSANSTQDN